jgi:hypothetical protein
MISGGSERVVKVSGVTRRPSIRPKPVTPPRSSLAPTPTPTPTWRLPPVRAPEPRVARRPTLVLVEEDESVEELVMPAPFALPSARSRMQPRTLGLAVAAVLAAAFTTAAVVWTASARRDAAEAKEVVSTTTLASASLSMPVAPAAPPRAKAAAAPSSSPRPAIPVVDVNSLPSVPGRIASGASR